MSYVDVLYIYAIARAGYIPQLFSLRLPNPEVIYELLAKADGKAIIYEPELADTVSNCPCPAYSAGDLRNVDIGDAPVPPMPRPSSADDIAMIFHTSGSTSGRPKLLPCNYKWLDAMVDKSARTSRPLRKNGQDVTVAMYVPSSLPLPADGTLMTRIHSLHQGKHVPHWADVHVPRVIPEWRMHDPATGCDLLHGRAGTHD